MTRIYPIMGHLTDKFGCRTVVASRVFINKITSTEIIVALI